MSCFQGLFFCPDAASLLLHNFCIYHIDAPGHEVSTAIAFFFMLWNLDCCLFVYSLLIGVSLAILMDSVSLCLRVLVVGSWRDFLRCTLAQCWWPCWPGRRSAWFLWVFKWFLYLFGLPSILSRGNLRKEKTRQLNYFLIYYNWLHTNRWSHMILFFLVMWMVTNCYLWDGLSFALRWS